jgi:hypothetical protein
MLLTSQWTMLRGEDGCWVWNYRGITTSQRRTESWWRRPNGRKARYFFWFGGGDKEFSKLHTVHCDSHTPQLFPDDLDPDGLAVASPSYIIFCFLTMYRMNDTRHTADSKWGALVVYTLLWEDCLCSKMSCTTTVILM